MPGKIVRGDSLPAIPAHVVKAKDDTISEWSMRLCLLGEPKLVSYSEDPEDLGGGGPSSGGPGGPLMDSPKIQLLQVSQQQSNEGTYFLLAFPALRKVTLPSLLAL